MYRFISSALCALSLSMPAAAFAAPVVFQASGVEPAEIQSTVDAFRAALGNLNPNQVGSFPDGRREVNWDGVPDALSAPNFMPPNQFNIASPRGVVFFTPGVGFQVSARDVNPTNTPIEFGNIRKFFEGRFRVFSPQRLFTAIGSNVTETLFFEPGTNTPATTNGFGAVFTDVNRSDSTSIEYVDVNGNVILRQPVPAGPGRRENLSFVGVYFDAGEEIYMVRLISGNRPLGDGGDEVAMDDFIYGEPQPIED